MKTIILKIKHQFEHFQARMEEFSDWIAIKSASPWFLLSHLVWWVSWIGFKVEVFPFGLLTLIVSLESIILSSLLLSSGNREGDIEKKIARKTLRMTTENSMISEESLELLREIDEALRNHLEDDREE